MNHLLDEDDALNPRQDRELTLSTGAILGIFLGLVLVCGLFFAFGYNLGQKSRSAAVSTDAAAIDATGSTTVPGNGHAKPSAGSYTTDVPAKAKSQTVAPTPATAATQTAASTAPTPATAEPAPAPVSHPAVPVGTPMPATSANGTFVVQIAAVTRQDDANMLVKALHGRGYAVAARNEPGDQLIHIQIGPFDTKAEATAMRDRLLSDGYNAIVK